MTIGISRKEHKDDYFVCITERDHTDIFKNSGAIVGEQYLNKADLDSISERSVHLHRYGKVWIAQLVIIGEADDIEIIDYH